MTEKKILVDTSAWILGFRGSAPAALQGFLKEAIDQNRVVLTPLIILELLQGCRTEMEFGDLKEKLESFESCPLDAISWKDAYRLGFSLRRKDLTIPTLGLLVASLCMKNRLTLLHHDHHFQMIARHSSLDAVDFLPPLLPPKQP